METDRQNLGLYTVHVEGSVIPLKDREFITSVVARVTEGEMENALVTATPEQAAKLPEFLRIQEIAPATDGIYVGQSGAWFAVKHGEVADTGQWLIPHDVLTSFSDVASPAVSVATQRGPGERDPVCGLILRPGQEEADVRYQEQTYHFCSTECRSLFLKNPAQYIQSLAGASQSSNN
jgi:YHS domain-containing protein